jgi:hypothetical protein
MSHGALLPDLPTSRFVRARTEPEENAGSPSDGQTEPPHEQGPDFDDMSSFLPCVLCDARKYINPGDELLVTEM